MNLTKIGTITRNWVDSTQDGNYWRVLVNAALNLRVPSATEFIIIIIIIIIVKMSYMN